MAGQSISGGLLGCCENKTMARDVDLGERLAKPQTAQNQYNQGCAPSRPPNGEIEDRLEILAQANRELAGRVQVLGDKLAPALRPACPTETISTPCEANSEIGNLLNQQIQQVRYAASMVEDLIGRLEI